MRNLKMDIEYDGTEYHGWQRQLGQTTIQQVLEESIGSVTQEKVRVIGSGRTDAGVHAINQVANFRTDSKIAVRNLHAGINSILPNDIVIRNIVEAEESFHARYDAKSKVYLYRIFNGTVRPALQRQYAWFVRGFLDIDLMKEGATLFSGTHDFSSFCAADRGIINYIKTIEKVEICRDQSSIISIHVEADGFLRYMVRNMVGILVEVGKGKKPPNEIAVVMEAKDRRRAGATAPAHGLFLKEVRY